MPTPFVSSPFPLQKDIFTRRNALHLLENPVEIRNIVESHLIADFCYGYLLLFQQPAGKLNAVFIEISDESLPRDFLEKDTERSAVHPHVAGNVIQRDVSKPQGGGAGLELQTT